MQRTATLEQFEQLVLAAVATLDDAYGVTIRGRVQEFSGRQLQFGPVYSRLNRLENKGYVSSWVVPGTAKRWGRPKRNYKIEPTGRKALDDSFRTADRVFAAMKIQWGFSNGTETASGS